MRSLWASFATAVMFGALAGSAQAQDPSVPQEATPQAPEARLDDVVVEGRRLRLREATADYVGRIAAPARGGGAAVWRQPLCIGVGNLQPATGQAVIDAISDVAVSLGVSLDRPGCEPRVFIVFAADPDAAAQDMVASRRREFRIGVAGADRGTRAFEAFQHSTAPVRWWQVSLPVNAETGRAAERLPGTQPFSRPQTMTRPADFGESVTQALGSRLNSPFRDDLAQVIIIVDIDAAAGVSFAQLSDYLAMIALAQIDPEADPGGYDTILSLFKPGGAPPPGLTDWDRAFLNGLYGAEQDDRNPNARVGAVADAMAEAVRVQQRQPAP